MTANIQVYNLATREKLQDLSNTSIVDLSASSVVKVDLYKEDIKQYVREGNNLVLVLNSGGKILIEDFFVQFNDQPQSQLVLLDEECGFLWFDYNNGAVYFKDITGLEQIVFGKSTNFWPWILGGLLLGGGIAALVDDDDKDPANPTTVTGNDGKGVEDDGAITGTVVAEDKDGVTNPDFTIINPPKNGTATIDPDTGEWSYVPNDDWHGTDSFTVTVTDDKGVETEFVVTVDVDPEQDAFDDSAKTDEDTPITLDVLANDEFEGDNPVITHVNGQPVIEGTTVPVEHGEVTLTGGKLVFKPAPNYAGPVEFEYTAVTDDGIAEDAQVNITVTPVDDGISEPDPNKPTQGNDAGTGPEDTVITGDLDVVDPDGINKPNFTLNTPPEHGTATIDPITGAWSYTPKPDWHGTDSFTVTVTDDQGFTTDIPINVTVEPEQDAFDDSAKTDEDTLITLDVLANDEFEGDNPVITHVNGQPVIEGSMVAVTNGEVTLTGGKLVFQPAPNYAGPVEFEYTAVTDDGIAEDAQVNITVKPVNDPPVAEDDQIKTPEDTPITGTVPATDPDGDDLTFVVGEPPKNGTLIVDPDTGEYTYTPNPDYSGPDEFTVVVTDPDGEETTSTIVVDVRAQDDSEVLYLIEDSGVVTSFTEDDAGTTIVRTSLIDDDVKNDPGIQIAHFRVGDDETIYQPGQEHIIQNYGTIRINSDGTFAFTPAKDFYSEVQGTEIYPPPIVHYTLKDNDGLRETSTVAFHVEGVNDAPVLLDTDVTINSMANALYYFDLDDFEASDVDHDIETATLVLTEGPTNGILEYFNRNAWVRLNEGDRVNYSAVKNGRFRYKPNDATQPSETYDSFKLQPDDGIGGSGLGEEATITIRVLPKQTIVSPNATITGSEGNDVIVGSSSVSQVIHALHGNDFIFSDGINTDSFNFPGRTSPNGSGLDAVIEHLKKNITGGQEPTEKQILQQLLEHPEFFPTTGGADVIYAGAGRDIIFSGGGNDIIHASQGNDVIVSGAGSDTLIYDVLTAHSDNANAGHSVDTWYDFNPSEDTIQFDPNVLLGANADNAAEYIQLTYNAQDKTVTLAIDRDGKQNDFVGYQPLLILENQNMALDLQKMLDDGRIIIG